MAFQKAGSKRCHVGLIDHGVFGVSKCSAAGPSRRSTVSLDFTQDTHVCGVLAGRHRSIAPVRQGIWRKSRRRVGVFTAATSWVSTWFHFRDSDESIGRPSPHVHGDRVGRVHVVGVGPERVIDGLRFQPKPMSSVQRCRVRNLQVGIADHPTQRRELREYAASGNRKFLRRTSHGIR